MSAPSAAYQRAWRKSPKGKASYIRSLANVQKIAHTLKQKMVYYKGGKCSKCGYNKCIASLDFHHRDPSTKLFGIADGIARKSPSNHETLYAELDKCDLLCRNCHQEIHYGVK